MAIISLTCFWYIKDKISQSTNRFDVQSTACFVRFFCCCNLSQAISSSDSTAINTVISTPRTYPAGNYIFKVNNRNTITRCEICSKLTIKTPERRRRRSCVFSLNFEHISHLVLMFLLLTLSKYFTQRRIQSINFLCKVIEWFLQTCTCSKSAIETFKKGEKVNNKYVNRVVLVSLLLTLNIFCMFY